MKLRLMVCTRCWADEKDLPDTPAQRSDLMALATVHRDSRQPTDDPDAIYVTPHKRDCTVLMRVLHDGGVPR